jgi:sugar phosphate isomerase/epimerase
MKLIAGFIISALGILAITSCNSNSSSGESADAAAVATDSAAPVSVGSTENFKLGVQMWTFRMFSLTDALNKVDSAKIKYIEAFWGQKLGGDMKGEFGIKMSAEDREKLKKLLQSKGITIVAMGVISPGTKEDWVQAFELAKEFGLKYITAEPKREFWDLADSLAGAAGIKIAIHDHPKPNAYQHPDSVLAAMQGHKNIGACADIGHWARNGLDPVECMKKLDGHIYGVHLKDIVKFDDPKAADTVVGKGVINIPATLAELKRQSFNGMLSIEHESNWYNNLPDVIIIREYYDAEVAKLNNK